ncbi:peptidoglycan-binding domain-containing protein [Actinacidiphila oryziradicis]|uniref:peptidoglycan-binding domain-containing protein n=1 Tax=Actinacidiphila oryziradicis TaxID=2571141 RepID=UPI001FE44E1E|nr:peptidoglycan-binding domain-containing protein [Actinacidiphila oryziradicis]
MADHNHPGRPSGRTVIEPTRVIGPLRTSRRLDDDDLFRPADPAPRLEPASALPPPSGSEDDTTELDLGLDKAGPAAGEAAPERHAKQRGTWQGKRLHAVVAASIASGFVLAMVLTARIVIPASPTTPQAAATASATPTQPVASQAAQPSAAAVVVLRQGDSGPEVSDLQSRLLRIPNVYPDGKVDGQYDAVLTEAVARFQLWYGIRGDEDGEYGDATRRDLESRTS